MAETHVVSEREELWRRMRALQQRQADLRELRAWLEGRSAARQEHDLQLSHDEAFLEGTKPILEWLEAEIAAVEKLLGS